jgi:acetylornithine deacetylase/succinyl-diaminopimelate desuccinylase-like protein
VRGLIRSTLILELRHGLYAALRITVLPKSLRCWLGPMVAGKLHGGGRRGPLGASRLVRLGIAALSLSLWCVASASAASASRSDWEQFREIYKELVETNTTLSQGDCTRAAELMAKRLQSAGYSSKDVRVFTPAGHPQEGGLIAELQGSDASQRAVLMLAHLDVVEARREDWSRDPFKLVEDGYFYGRGGKPIALGVLAGEKLAQNFVFEVTNADGHSSRPVPDNAIYHLIRAVDRVSHYEFPVEVNDASRAYLLGMSTLVAGEEGAAMARVAANSQDTAAVAILDKDPEWHAVLHTTCVATMLTAGHATNALPQRARANINCRIMTDTPREAALAQLVALADDSKVVVSVPEIRGPVAPSAPLTPQVMNPIREAAHDIWPGVPVVPIFEAGATDAQFLNPAGVPTYGVSGLFIDPDGGHTHGLNERVRVESVQQARRFLYKLVKLYANQ